MRPEQDKDIKAQFMKYNTKNDAQNAEEALLEMIPKLTEANNKVMDDLILFGRSGVHANAEGNTRTLTQEEIDSFKNK